MSFLYIMSKMIEIFGLLTFFSFCIFGIATYGAYITTQRKRKLKPVSTRKTPQDRVVNMLNDIRRNNLCMGYTLITLLGLGLIVFVFAVRAIILTMIVVG